MIKKKPGKTKATLVAECLSANIIEGTFAPGEKLSMQALKEFYGVSYSALREALSRLLTQGLVTIKEQCGFYVAQQSLDELYDLYATRITVETEALKLSIILGNDQWEADVIAAWHCAVKYTHPDKAHEVNIDQWDILHQQFIYALMKGCQSPWLLKIQGLLSDHASRYRRFCISNHQNNKQLRKEYIEENQRIVDAIVLRNVELAIEHYQARAKKNNRPYCRIIKK